MSLLFVISLSPPVLGNCLAVDNGKLACTGDTTTVHGNDSNGIDTNSQARSHTFSDGYSIAASIGSNSEIKGAGLALVNEAALPSIVLLNAGAVSATQDRTGGVELADKYGSITYQGAGSIANSLGAGLEARSSGDISITNGGQIVSGASDGHRNGDGRTDTPVGILALERADGSITIDGNGSVFAPAGRGIVADERGSKAMGGITVTGSGDVTSEGAICPGVPDIAKAHAHGETGCSGIRATIDNSKNTSNIVIARSGNITATSAAINALTAGDGNILVQTGAGTHLVGASEFGIEAKSKGTGNIDVATGPENSIVSGGSGILAVDKSDIVPTQSVVAVHAAGNITSGLYPAARLDRKNPTNTLGGISAGYAGGTHSQDGSTVFGRVSIDNDATITAKSGDGILGYNSGLGYLDIDDTGSVAAAAGDGIATKAPKAVARINIQGSGATVTGTGQGKAGIDAQSNHGAVELSLAPGASLVGTNGAVGAKLDASLAMVDNMGTLSGRAGLVGKNVRLFNAGLVVGTTYGIDFTGGFDQVGGPGRIEGGVDVSGKSIFRPALGGTPIGSMVLVDGALSFGPMSAYRVRVSSHAADRTATTQIASLSGATLQLDTGGVAPRSGASVVILSAAQGFSGHFGTVESGLAFLAPSLSYGRTDLTVTFGYDYRLPGGTTNQNAVGAALDVTAPSTSSAAIWTALQHVSKTQGANVIDSLSGEGITAAQNVAQRSAQLFTSSIFDQTTFYGSANSITLTERPPIRELADLPARAIEPVVPVIPNRTWRAWASGFGGIEDIHANATIGSAAQQNTIYGGVLGVDYQLMPNYLVGVAVGGSDGAFSVPGRATSGSTTGGHVAFYDLATFGAFYGASSTSFSYFDNRTTRSVSGFGGLATETERGTFDSHEFRTRLEFGRHVDGFGGVLTPFVAMEIAELRSNGFGETAISGPGLFRLNVQGQSAASVPSFVGARLQGTTSIGNGMTITPILQAAWVHEFAPYRSQFAAIADLPGSTFLVDGARPARDAAQIKAGAELAIGPNSVIFANFDGELSGASQLYAGKGGFRYTW